jgi:hypothetical protein
MTIYPARRKDDRILCGRPGCGDVLAFVPGEPGPLLMFPAWYEPAAPLLWAADTLWTRDHPEERPVTVLRIGGPAAARMARGQPPRRRPFRWRRYPSPAEAARVADLRTTLVTSEDGAMMECTAYRLPVILPCRHRHLCRIDSPTPSVLE